jgi:diaminohydroxyphosphoribosylaminopyrimidine deaminase / 5-amino-6-(5-phosphoribosylamino)uracil reductase
MRQALALARRAEGITSPNPWVGCLLVRDGVVVGRGWTQPGGRPHAETEALRRAGKAAQGATAYVTLEPCAHHGRTGPCADALVAAGIARCVAAIEDPDRRVAGAGLRKLRAGSVAVATGVLAEEASSLLAGYLLRQSHGRPLVTLKLAATLDGRIATRNGESRWITGEPARMRAHLLRARHEAVLVGFGTALADDPELICRVPGLEDRSPVRVILDGDLRLPLTSRVVQTARSCPTWLITSADADPARRGAYADAGVEFIDVARDADRKPDLHQAMARLAQRGISSLLLEGGSRVAAALLRAGLVDRLAWFSAPRLIGGDGVAAVGAFGLSRLADSAPWRRIATEAVGEDLLETFERPR